MFSDSGPLPARLRTPSDGPRPRHSADYRSGDGPVKGFFRLGGARTGTGHTSGGPTPHGVSTRLDLDNDPFRDRPEPRNSRRGDAATTLDLRATKIFKTGRMRTSAFWELFNAFNTTNFTAYQGSLQSATFGRPVAALPMRRQQVGRRLDF